MGAPRPPAEVVVATDVVDPKGPRSFASRPPPETVCRRILEDGGDTRRAVPGTPTDIVTHVRWCIDRAWVAYIAAKRPSLVAASRDETLGEEQRRAAQRAVDLLPLVEVGWFYWPVNLVEDVMTSFQGALYRGPYQGGNGVIRSHHSLERLL